MELIGDFSLSWGQLLVWLLIFLLTTIPTISMLLTFAYWCLRLWQHQSKVTIHCHLFAGWCPKKKLSHHFVDCAHVAVWPCQPKVSISHRFRLVRWAQVYLMKCPTRDEWGENSPRSQLRFKSSKESHARLPLNNHFRISNPRFPSAVLPRVLWVSSPDRSGPHTP